MSNRQIKSIIIALIVLATGGVTYSTNHTKSYSKKKIPEIKIGELYQVSKVADGDTFDIKVEGQTVKVRMLGIDTPETVDPRKTVQCFGKEASDTTKSLLTKNSVTLETDPTQGITDRYGRILAYVYKEDGLFVNKYLIENGYAHEYTYNIPYQKQKEFKQLEREAREGQKGLWGSLCKTK